MLSPEFERLLASLQSGREPGPATWSLLSDLSRDEAAALEAVWPAVPGHVRTAVVQEALLLAANDVSYDFERPLLVALGDPLADVRRLAAAALAESPTRPAAMRLATVLQEDPDRATRLAAADSLAPFVSAFARGEAVRDVHTAILAALRGAATDPAESVDVRARALAAAAGSAEAWLEPLIEDLFYDGDNLLKVAAIEAMGLTCDEGWLDLLLDTLEFDDPSLRQEAARALGELGSEEAVDALAALAGDDDPLVASAAVEAIGRIGGASALAALRDLAEEPPVGLDPDEVRDAIAEASGSRDQGPGALRAME